MSHAWTNWKIITVSAFLKPRHRKKKTVWWYHAWWTWVSYCPSTIVTSCIHHSLELETVGQGGCAATSSYSEDHLRLVDVLTCRSTWLLWVWVSPMNKRESRISGTLSFSRHLEVLLGQLIHISLPSLETFRTDAASAVRDIHTRNHKRIVTFNFLWHKHTQRLHNKDVFTWSKSIAAPLPDVAENSLHDLLVFTKSSSVRTKFRTKL